jgi:hypothetical protein
MVQSNRNKVETRPMKKRYSQVLIRISLRRPAFYFLLSTFSILLFPVLTLQSCGLDIEDPTPPSAPVWIQKSLPEDWPERGIDAHESGGIFFEWEPNINQDISSYYIFRASWFELNDSLGDFEQIAKIGIEQLSILEFRDPSVEVNVRYAYMIRAEDISSSLSEYSDTLFYSLLPSLSRQTMIPNGQYEQLNPERTLSWRYDYSIEMDNYCVTLLDLDNHLIKRELLSPGNYVGDREFWPIPHGVALDSGQVYKWRIDTCGKYVEDHETAGSESFWATFLFAGG